MDINDLRAAITVVSFIGFIGIVWWAYSARRKSAFDRAARSVLEEEEEDGHAAPHGEAK